MSMYNTKYISKNKFFKTDKINYTWSLSINSQKIRGDQ